MSIEVVAYDVSWPTRFEEVAATLRSALGVGPGARVEHVGSTSVPRLAAKSDVLQKVLAVSDLTDAERSQILSLNDPSR